MNKLLIIACLLLGLLALWYYRQNPLSARVKINNQTILIEIAATPVEKERGLGGRQSLKPGHGMLFPYDHADYFQFWMKDMQFPLDFVWIKDKTVVDLTENVPVASTSFLPIYKAKVPVDKILEINAGEIKKFGIQIGDIVKFEN